MHGGRIAPIMHYTYAQSEDTPTTSNVIRGYVFRPAEENTRTGVRDVAADAWDALRSGSTVQESASTVQTPSSSCAPASITRHLDATAPPRRDAPADSADRRSLTARDSNRFNYAYICQTYLGRARISRQRHRGIHIPFLPPLLISSILTPIHAMQNTDSERRPSSKFTRKRTCNSRGVFNMKAIERSGLPAEEREREKIRHGTRRRTYGSRWMRCGWRSRSSGAEMNGSSGRTHEHLRSRPSCFMLRANITYPSEGPTLVLTQWPPSEDTPRRSESTSGIELFTWEQEQNTYGGWGVTLRIDSDSEHRMDSDSERRLELGRRGIRSRGFSWLRSEPQSGVRPRIVGIVRARNGNLCVWTRLRNGLVSSIQSSIGNYSRAESFTYTIDWATVGTGVRARCKKRTSGSTRAIAGVREDSGRTHGTTRAWEVRRCQTGTQNRRDGPRLQWIGEREYESSLNPP
ncbi:hypothetical protein C8R44DRAFT_749002 [Mycena epipterygia]|nr:hypothetical protein C8R44DRAFT_749002 [Mycena epipterygia]